MPQAQQLGRYHLLDRIAYGGMAEIFRAKTFEADGQVRLVAVKRILRHLVQDEDVLQMLVDEAKVTAVLRHENIAQLYEFARDRDEYFLAIEYVDGKDVRAIIENARTAQRWVPPEDAAWIVMETATALHAAHCQHDAAGRALRIVHRDVSPSNILCSYRGEVKLCDFGIAKATLTRMQTRTGVIKGKVKYMSPEQAMGRTLDHRSDLFSLGTVLYELLALQAPFQAATEVELIFAVREAKKRPISDVRTDVPPSLAAILERSMSRPRNARYQSGEEMATDLRVFLDGHARGYRRGNFAQHMRDTFSTEIEAELRQLEGYVLEQPDVSRIGENLIADVLGPDAPFTRFSPLGGLPTSDVRFPVEADGLYAQPTRLLDRGSLRPDGDARAALPSVRSDAGVLDLSDGATQMKAGGDARSIHQEETRIRVVAPEILARLSADTGPRRARSIFDEETGRKALLTESEAGGDGVPVSDSAVVEVDSGAFEVERSATGSDLHQEATRIFRRSDIASAPALPPTPAPRPAAGVPAPRDTGDFSRDTLTDAERPPIQPDPRVAVGPLRPIPSPATNATHTYTGAIFDFDADPDLDEEFALPLGDEDLEEVEP